MMTVHRTTLAVALVLLAGCGGLFKRTQSQFYSLETTRVDTRLPGRGGALPIGVDGIELPPGIDRRELVVRGENNRFEIRGTQLWASPLEEMVIHTLSFNLANRLPEGRVILPGQARPAGAIRSIYVTFEDLAAGPEQTFVLDARWMVTEPGTTGASLARHERITVPMSSLDSAQIATAMSTALAQLADRIAAAM